MKTVSKKILAALAFAAVSASSAFAGAVIMNPSSTVALGVNDLGHLNFSGGLRPANASAMGLAIKDAAGAFQDSTAPGCLCEGWGVSTGGSAGYANVAVGTGGLSLISFSSTASTATSETRVTGTDLVVKQEYSVSPESSSVFVDKVTLTNTGAGILTGIKFVRVMDWDVPPTEFSEYVTIKGTGTTTLLDVSHDDGFESSNPLVSTSAIMAGTTNTDFTDFGRTDHGAYFRFKFADLAAGESFSFNTYYGATYSEASAITALGAIGAELYSLGQSSTGGSPYTFLFAFKGVGGEIIEPPTGAVPEPSTYGLMGAAGLLGLSYLRRRSQKK